MLHGGLASVDHSLTRVPIADPDLPQVAHADGSQYRDAAGEYLAQCVHVAFGAVRTAAFDVKLAAERVERVGAKRERPACKHQRVEPVLEPQRSARPRALGGEKAHVPHGRVRDEDRALDRSDDLLGQLRKSARDGKLVGAYPVHVRRPVDSTLGVDETVDGRDPALSHVTLDTDLDDPILRRIETGHFQIDERDGRSRDRQVPGRPDRRRIHAGNLMPSFRTKLGEV